MAEPRCHSDRPALKDLATRVIPFVKTEWYDLGLQLLKPKYQNELNAIEADTRNDAATCCRKMFSKWLNTDELASWDKLIRALRVVQLNNVASNIEQLLPPGIDHEMPQVPVITSHPHDVKGLHGHQLILEVKAYGTMPLCYQWYFEYDVIHGENKSFYSIYPVTVRNAGRYYCQVINQFGVANSNIATVFVSTLSSPKTPSNISGYSYSPVHKCSNLVSQEELTTSQQKLILETRKSSPTQETVMTDYGSSENIDVAFSTFVDEMFDVLDQENFNKVQRKCLENLNVVGGLSLSMDIENRVEDASNLGDLFKVMCRCRPYWNWMNIRILEKMAGNSLAAKRLIEKYKKKVFTRKVKDVLSEISDLEIPTDKYTEVKEKWNKEFDDLLIQDIVKRWSEIEKKLNVEETMLLKSITAGCVEIRWLLRSDLVDYAICSATNSHQSNTQEHGKHYRQSTTEGPVKHDDQLSTARELVKDNQLATQELVKNGDQSATVDLFPEVLHLKIGDKVIKDDVTSFFRTGKEVFIGNEDLIGLHHHLLDVQDDLGTLDFTMKKYSRKKDSKSSPHKRIFTVDKEKLLLMWRQTTSSKFDQSDTLLTEKILEVREGQNSDRFAHYPNIKHKKHEEQSFSLIFEGEMQAGPRNNTYAVLQSLDLICDSHEEQQLHCQTFKSLISPKRHVCMFSSRFQLSDPTILLKSYWIVLAEGGSEIREDVALSFGKRLVPAMSNERLQSFLDIAHQSQLRESIHHGSSLYWDGLILFYNLLCGIDQPYCPVLDIFRTYARDYPNLGMTVKEFRNFLITHQEWSPNDAMDLKCDRIMRRYDYHHRAFKMYLAERKPIEFHISLRLFSFAGFLSFLRSVDNSVIYKEHEDIYQDMNQPLSHYFINTSCNTYLEGHQLTGRSTTDAYVRALLQGCRCLELDCWDGPNGEPKVTHGNTLVSDLSLEEVARTIDKYAFYASTYPLILSLKNHCSAAQQVRMAGIFQYVFGSKLVKENLVEKENLERLPSPKQLQGMIIVKGRVMDKEKKSLLGLNEDEEEKPEYDQEELFEGLDNLIVYCRSKKIRPWSWDKQLKTSICNMFSFSESTALSRCEDTREMLACTERQLVRTYPSGVRTNSSNYIPLPMWNHGIHMVALNVQTPGLSMFLNQGKFRQNGGCGYILKPKVMRDPDEKEYTPHMKEPHHAVTPINLEITLLSGQNLLIPGKKTTHMEILYQTHGIPHDCEQQKYTISSVETNPLWPQIWHTPRVEKTILMPELCLVLFAVNIHVQQSLLAGPKNILLGQNVFPLTSLKPGLKFIPLRTPGGEITSHIGLFVKINIEKLRHLVEGPKDLDSSTQPTPTKACHRSKSLENMVNYNKDKGEQEITLHSALDNSANSNLKVLSKSAPQLFHQ